jgi:2-dehydropantoate 2-reductase
MGLSPKKYIIIGTGALGGFYGARLSNSGQDVHFLVRSDYDYIRKHGLTIISKSGNVFIDKVNCYKKTEDMPKGNVILIATKALSNNELKHLILPVLKETSTVVLLQNGLGGEDYLADIIDNKRLFGGLSILAVSKDSPGVIKHHDFGSIKIGQFNPDNLPREISSDLQEIVNDISKAGIEAAAVHDLMQARWEKLVWNIPFSGLSVLLDADTRQIVSSDYSLQLAKEIIKDVARAAAACGKIISKDFEKKMVEITVSMTPYFPSMKLDFDSGKPMEIEAIFGNPLRAAEKAGYYAPFISMLYHSLKFIENRDR